MYRAGGGCGRGARDHFAALLPIPERVLRPGAPSTPSTPPPARQLIPGEAGDPAGSRDQLAALLPVRDRVLGPEHPHTLTTRHSLEYRTRKVAAAD